MSEKGDTLPTTHNAVQLLRWVQAVSVLLSLALVVISWFTLSETMTYGVLMGGVLVNVSFLLQRRDISSFIDNFSQAAEQGQATPSKKLEKVKFFGKFYARLATMGVIIFLLITRFSLDPIGLVIGLSTIMVSVVVVVLWKGSTLLSA